MTAPFVNDRPDFVFLAVRHVIVSLHPELDAEAIFIQTRGPVVLARARQIGMYVMVERLGLAQGETARQFDRDRTTVLHAEQTIGALIETCPETARMVDRVERDVRSVLDIMAMVESAARPGFAASARNFHG